MNNTRMGIAMGNNISIIGAGSWGTALGIHLSKQIIISIFGTGIKSLWSSLNN